jgi:hypothetical protein
MINQVDESLQNMLRSDVLGGTDVDVVLEAPTREWAARHTAPVVNLYLYDIREDTTRRAVGRIAQQDEVGRIVGYMNPPRTYKLAYLVTAWTQRPEDEHRLLSAVLGCLLANDYIPEPYLTDIMRDNGVKAMVQVGAPPAQDRQVSDVWTALGGNLKPSLDMVVSVPLDAGTLREAAPLVEAPMQLRTRGFNSMEMEDGTKHHRQLEVVGAAAESAGAESGPSKDEASAAPRPKKRGTSAKKESAE